MTSLLPLSFSHPPNQKKIERSHLKLFLFLFGQTSHPRGCRRWLRHKVDTVIFALCGEKNDQVIIIVIGGAGRPPIGDVRRRAAHFTQLAHVVVLALVPEDDHDDDGGGDEDRYHDQRHQVGDVGAVVGEGVSGSGKD